MRLQKYLAACGIASRRAAETMIAEGKVTVNGAIVTQPGVKVRPGKDKVAVAGRETAPPANEHVYILMNKPRGYVVTAHDERERKTVYELLPKLRQRVFPVGRLDRDSEGLLLFMSNGELAHRLMHPRFEVAKEYEVKAEGKVTEAEVEKLIQGVELDDGPASAASAVLLHAGTEGSRLHMIIKEGRKRQVRRMLEAVGHPVVRLRRLREGTLRMQGLGPGQTRELTAREVADLHREVGLAAPAAAASPGKAVKSTRRAK